MLNKAGPWLVWLLFLGTTWYFARPVLIFLAALAILAAVLLGVLRKLEEQGEEIAKGWKKDERDK